MSFMAGPVEGRIIDDREARISLWSHFEDSSEAGDVTWSTLMCGKAVVLQPLMEGQKDINQ